MKYISKILIIAIVLNSCANNFIYSPSHDDYGNFEHYEYKNIKIDTQDKEKLDCILYYAKNIKDSNKTIMLFHGNTDNITTINPELLNFLDNGYNLFLFDYRGFGKSTGSPSPQGLNIDSRSVLNYAIKEYTQNNKKLIIYAQSLGGAVALNTIGTLKQQNKISLIIVEGSFLSYKEVAKDKYFSFASLFVDDTYSPLNTNLKIPLLIIHSKDDKVIPIEHGIALNQFFIKSIFWETFDKHITFFNYSMNRKKLFNFIKDY